MPRIMLTILLLAAIAQDPNDNLRISPDDPASVARGLDSAIKSGRSRVVIPPGTYRLPSVGRRYYLTVEGARDLDILATGVTLLLEDPSRGGFEFVRSRNVKLSGVTLLHAVPPFTQGRIESIAPDELNFDLRIAKGYPTNFTDPKSFPVNPFGFVFDSNSRQWKAGTIDLTPDRVERLEEGLFRLHWKRPSGPSLHPVVRGDLMAFRGRVQTDIFVGGCAGITLENVTIEHGSGFCVHEYGGEGGNRYRYTVTYGPPPRGATETPLISCNADAFHSSGVRKGPTLEGCLFEGMCDDGIAIHGSYGLIVESRDSSWVVTDGVLREGDPVRLFSPDGGLAGEARVKSVRKLPEYKPVGKSRYNGFSDLQQFRYCEALVDPPIPAGFDWAVSNPAATGSGYVIQNNIIRKHRARGMLLKAEDGLVEGNTVDGSTIAGIVLAPEFWWRESCYSRNIIIRNNTIRHCGYATVGPWTGQAGALSVCAEADPAAAPGHRNILIEKNRFLDNDGTNLLLQAVDGATVRDNNFERPGQAPTQRGSGHKIDPGRLIWISSSSHLRFEGNLVTGAGPALKGLVGIGLHVQELDGVETGLTRKTAVTHPK
jgi:hypothetical protein